MRCVVLLLDNSSDLVEHLGIVARCVSAALLLSHGIRKDATFRLYLREEGLVASFEGSRLRGVRADEQSLGGIIRKIYREAMRGISRPRNVHYGVALARSGLDKMLRGAPGSRAYYVDHRRGIDLRRIELRGLRSVTFVLSMGETYTPAELEVFKRRGLVPVRVSPARLYPESLIVLLNNELDRAEASWRS